MKKLERTQLSFNLTPKRKKILMRLAEEQEKTMTQLIFEWIDRAAAEHGVGV